MQFFTLAYRLKYTFINEFSGEEDCWYWHNVEVFKTYEEAKKRVESKAMCKEYTQTDIDGNEYNPPRYPELEKDWVIQKQILKTEGVA